MLYKKKRRGAQPYYTGSIKRERLVRRRKKNKKLGKLITSGASQAAVHVNNVKRKKCISSSKVLVESSKHLALLSLHKHHIRHKGIIFHTTALRERPPVHSLPTSIQILHPVRHNPIQPEPTKDNMP